MSEEDLKDPDVLGKKLMTLVEIVISRHYYASQSYIDDLRSVGLVKAMSLIHEGNFDKSKGNFVTYLYTGIRNDLHNHLYHLNKIETVDLDVLINQGEEDKYFADIEEVPISYSLIHTVCMDFMSVFGNNIETLIIKNLEEMGYTVKGRKDTNPTFMYVYDPIIEEYGVEAEEDIISRIIGIILWKKHESSY